MAVRFYIDLRKASTPAAPVSKEAQVKASPEPKGVATPASVGDKADRKALKYGQPAAFVDKNRYPKRPDNAIGDTKATWVIPKGQKPMYGGAAAPKKEEESGKKEAKPELAATGKQPAVLPKDHGEVKKVEEKSPSATSQTLLTSTEQKPATKEVKKEEDPKAVMAKLNSGEVHVDEEGTKLYSKRDKHGKLLAHVSVGKDGKKDFFRSDEELQSHLSKKNGGSGAATPSADDHEAVAKVAKESLQPNIAAGHAKMAEAKKKREQALKDKEAAKTNKVKADNAAADEAASEFSRKQAAKKQAEHDRKVVESRDIDTADKAAAQFRQQLAKKKAANEKKAAAKLERQKRSADEKVAKEAIKQDREQKEEKARKNKAPDSPEGLASHAIHQKKAKETSDKIDSLLSDNDVDQADKDQLTALKAAVGDHANQKHEPNSEERRRLGELAKVVNHLDGKRSKENKALERDKLKNDKLKVKEEAKAHKDEEKATKDKAKAEEKAAREQAKSDKEEAKRARQEGTTEETIAHQNNKTHKEKIGLGAFHSGRAAGEQASTAAGSDTGGSLGSAALGGAATGVANVGHKLLGGEEEKDKTTFATRKVKPPESLTKSLWFAADTEYEDTTSMLKSLNKSLKRIVKPVTLREVEFLTKECGYQEEEVRKGLVTISGTLEVRYSKWLAQKSIDSINTLRKMI